MQRILFAALLGGASLGAHAQTAIGAGTVLLGGSVGYSRSSQESPVYSGGYPSYSSTVTSTNSQFTLAPSIGFFVADNLAVGINGNYQVNHYATTDALGNNASSYKAHQFQVGPFVQYYQMLSEQFGFTGTLGAGYQSSTQPYTNAPGGSKGKGYYAALTPGIVFFPVPKLAIGAAIGGLDYIRSKIKADNGVGSDNYTTSTFGADFGLNQLTFSGTYYFRH